MDDWREVGGSGSGDISDVIIILLILYGIMQTLITRIEQIFILLYSRYVRHRIIIIVTFSE